MEALSLIKQWRGGGGAAPASSAAASGSVRATIATSALRPSTDSEDDDAGDEDEGPFFDLELAVHDDGDSEEPDGGAGGERDDSAAESEVEGDQREFNLAASSERSCCGSGAGLRSDPILSSSPSDDLFFKGRLLPLEPATLLFTASEPNSKPPSRVKPATKLRVLMLGFKKPKSTTAESSGAGDAPVAASPEQRQRHRKFFVKFKVEEVPIVSLFTRDSSSRSSSSSGKPAKMHAEDVSPSPWSAGTEDKRSSKDALQRYLSKIKPLYVRVSKRYGEKLGFSGQLTSSASDVAGTKPSPAASTNTKHQRPHGGGSLPSGLKVVCKRLGKSRSASAAVAAVRSPPVPLARRRDDSLLEQQDGIQSAIAHCKRSFNLGRGLESPLVRSWSDPGDERSVAVSSTDSSTVRSKF